MNQEPLTPAACHIGGQPVVDHSERRVSEVTRVDRWCVLCDKVAVGEVEASAGLMVGLCRDHLLRRTKQSLAKAHRPSGVDSPPGAPLSAPSRTT
jgi:hypothetical protein